MEQGDAQFVSKMKQRDTRLLLYIMPCYAVNVGPIFLSKGKFKNFTI